MKLSKIFIGIVSLLIVSILVVGCRAPAPAPSPTPAPPPAAGMQDIVDIAVDDVRFTTLVAALQAADLVDTLKGDGPFTVFAPDDEAFAKLPTGNVGSLLKDVPKLKDILTYHVVAGKVMAADVAGLTSAKTVQGKEVSIDTKDGVKMNKAKIIKADIEADNGVIHVIDTVLIP